MNIAVLVSGGGTNLQALIDAQADGGIINGRITAVISSKSEAYALKRAADAGISTFVVPRSEYSTREDFSDAILKKLSEVKADLVIFAGFNYILSDKLITAYEGKMINVHPSLIPAFCGDGYYGLRVHEEALKKGVKLSGATVHFVNEETDGGPIILQKAVEVLEDDTAETLQLRVMRQAEWELLPLAASLFCQGRLRIKDGKVLIQDKR